MATRNVTGKVVRVVSDYGTTLATDESASIIQTSSEGVLARVVDFGVSLRFLFALLGLRGLGHDGWLD